MIMIEDIRKLTMLTIQQVLLTFWLDILLGGTLPVVNALTGNALYIIMLCMGVYL